MSARLRIEAGDVGLEIDAEAGGRLSRLHIGPYDLLVGPSSDPITWGCYPMVPWAGRIGRARFDWNGETFDLEATLPPHAIHGTTHRRRWDVVDATTIRTELGSGWPFAGEAVQRFSLTADEMTVDLELRSLDRPFPATIGWHPWFRRTVGGAPATVRFDADWMYERGPDHLPTGQLTTPRPGPWDDAFTGVRWPVTIEWADTLHLRMESDLDHLVVYDETLDAVCVEPQSGPPDAIAHDLAATVAPDRPLTARMTWAWTVPDTRPTRASG